MKGSVTAFPHRTLYARWYPLPTITPNGRVVINFRATINPNAVPPGTTTEYVLLKSLPRLLSNTQNIN